MMFDDLFRTIKENESKHSFTYTTVTDNVLLEAEKQLNLKISGAYRWFVKTFGHGGIGFCIFGVGADGSMVFVDETLEYRSYGLPDYAIVIENCDEWVYCLDTRSGKVGMWSFVDKKYKDEYESFEVYLMDRINDILENRD
jgi:hypothetical protein